MRKDGHYIYGTLKELLENVKSKGFKWVYEANGITDIDNVLKSLINDTNQYTLNYDSRYGAWKIQPSCPQLEGLLIYSTLARAQIDILNAYTKNSKFESDVYTLLTHVKNKKSGRITFDDDSTALFNGKEWLTYD